MEPNLAFGITTVSLILSHVIMVPDKGRGVGGDIHNQTHVGVDMIIANTNKSTKASKRQASATNGNTNKPEPATDSPRKVRTTNNKNAEKPDKAIICSCMILFLFTIFFIEIFRTIHHFMPTFMTLSTHPIIRAVIYKVSLS
jgi:hypothetical protein